MCIQILPLLLFCAIPGKVFMSGLYTAAIATVLLIVFLFIKPDPKKIAELEEKVGKIELSKPKKPSPRKLPQKQKTEEAGERSQRSLRTDKAIELLVQVMEDGDVVEIQKAMANGINLRQKLENNTTLLMIAVKHNESPAVVRFLLSQGIEINETNDNGQTALMMAATFNPNPEIVKELLNSGADKTIKDKNGKTASDYVILNSSLFGTDVPDLLKV